MTREVFTTSPLYIISTTGPYPIIHPYQVDTEIKCTIFQGDTIVELPGADFSVAPTSSDTTGDVTLDAGIVSTYAGASLLIRRETVADQGWAGQTAREKGIEAQLDALTQRLQEIDEVLARSVKIPTGQINELVLDYASTHLAFDADKNLIASSGISDVPTTGFMATLLDDPDAVTALATLGAASLIASQTFTGINKFTGRIDLEGLSPVLRLNQTAAPADLKAWHVAALADGSLSIFPIEDGGVTHLGISITRDVTGPLLHKFFIQDGLAARIEAAGPAMSSNQAVVTKEKMIALGDARYAAIGGIGGVLSVSISSGSFDATGAGLVELDTEGVAATDVLRGIIGGVVGQTITIMQKSNSRVITLLDAYTGNPPPVERMILAGGFIFSSDGDTISLVKAVGDRWYEVARSVN